MTITALLILSLRSMRLIIPSINDNVNHGGNFDGDANTGRVEEEVDTVDATMNNDSSIIDDSGGDTAISSSQYKSVNTTESNRTDLDLSTINSRDASDYKNDDKYEDVSAPEHPMNALDNTTNDSNIIKSNDFTTEALASSQKRGDPNITVSNIFMCSYDVRSLHESIFPEHATQLKNAITIQGLPNIQSLLKNASEYDMVICGSVSPCDGWRKNQVKGKWFEDNFKGNVIYYNGEPNSGDPWITSIPFERQFHLGYGRKDGCQNIVFPFLSRFLNSERSLWPYILQEHKKPHSTREHFLIYTNKNCVGFREDAFDSIALANNTTNIFYGGKCSGSLTKKSSNVTNVKHYAMGDHGRYFGNSVHMRRFRFCLVMESSNLPGYITEKILNAFIGGCIPIYYGTDIVFDIFNPRAFIYYNISNPISALGEILRLERNQSAYAEVMAEPILLDGNNTIRKYLSVSDEMHPDGLIKHKIRKMIQNRGCKKTI